MMFAAYLALALALRALTALLTGAPHSLSRAFAALLCLLAAACLVPIALTARRDMSCADARTLFSVRLHRWTALLAFVSLVVAILSYAASVATRPLQVAAFALGCTALCALLAMVLVKPGTYHGALQKSLVTVIVLWIGLVSLTEGMA
jgi:hypothetical protein